MHDTPLNINGYGYSKSFYIYYTLHERFVWHNKIIMAKKMIDASVNGTYMLLIECKSVFLKQYT